MAAVSIATLVGDNGILNKANDAKSEYTIGEEKEQVSLAYSAGKLKNRGGAVTREQFENELREYEDGATVEQPEGGDFKVTFPKTGHVYTVKKEEISGPITGDVTVAEIEPGKRYEEDTKVKVGDDVVTIPGGITVSELPGEYEDVNKGIVAYVIPKGENVEDWDADLDSDGIIDVQENYDQFVWIPVKTPYVTEEEVNEKTENPSDAEKYENLKAYINEKNIYPMAIKLGDGSYKAILYDFEGTTSVTITPKNYIKGGNREPVYFKDENNEKVGITEDTMNTSFNTMVDRVANNGGFWVGRYESSNMSPTDDQQRIKVVKGATEGVSNLTVPNDGTGITWYRMYAQEKYYSTAIQIDMQSSMIWGCQWDQILIWMKDEPNTRTPANKYVTDAKGVGNFGSTYPSDRYPDRSPAPTGCYAVRNIYDLAGNVNDWTLEGHSAGAYRTHRGNDFYGTAECNPNIRYDGNVLIAGSSYGSRATMY